MGRHEKPLDPAAGPVEGFAAELRALRRSAGSPVYRAMAARVHTSASALSAAASGARLPTLPVTLAYVRACGGDEREWTARWHATARVLTPAPVPAPGRPPLPPPPPPAPLPARRHWAAWALAAGALGTAAALGRGSRRQVSRPAPGGAVTAARR
ncbi:helix-turn-helix domain-containing protein [Kitasatospora sp. NPDC002551]|uniref:helix-turn-helix domain-containing protein n=1 Tax=unclassified Kitasatospora TaxID=2633591 RepID=UPI00332F2E0F